MNDERLLIYYSEEEHLIRRLGSAVVSCWTGLAPEVQALLLDRATKVFDDEHPEDLEAELRRFIESHLVPADNDWTWRAEAA